MPGNCWSHPDRPEEQVGPSLMPWARPGAPGRSRKWGPPAVSVMSLGILGPCAGSLPHQSGPGHLQKLWTKYRIVSCSIESDSSRPHGLQHARLPWSLPQFMSTESVMPSNHLILCQTWNVHFPVSFWGPGSAERREVAELGCCAVVFQTSPS